MFIPSDKEVLEISVLKSKFIAISLPIESKDIKDILKSIKEEYPKASHYLYAYKYGEVMKSNDDNEPGSIARLFLKTIENYNLNNILVIVIRYFGGTKLGASRLTSTYSNLVNDLVKSIKKYELIDVYRYSLEVNYPTFYNLKNLGFHIENIEYFDKIKLDIISEINIDSKLLTLGIKSFKVGNIKRKVICMK